MAPTIENLVGFNLMSGGGGEQGLRWCIKLHPKLDRARFNQALDQTGPDTTHVKGTVPLPPRGRYQNNDITVALSVCDITKICGDD